MRKDKDIAFALRKEGKTYRQIQDEIGVSRGTLSAWFVGVEWSRHVKQSNIRKNQSLSAERIRKLNDARSVILEKRYMDALDEAGLDYERFKYETLFAAGLMLYAGEGNRVSRHSIRLANVDPGIHRVFLRFIEKYLKINVSNVKFSILLYPDLDAGACISYWIKELGVVKGNIHKPQVIKGRDVSGKKLHFGVGTSIISNSFLKKKLMYWVEKFKEDFGAAHAAID